MEEARVIVVLLTDTLPGGNGPNWTGVGKLLLLAIFVLLAIAFIDLAI
jgi:hypothetical protein